MNQKTLTTNFLFAVAFVLSCSLNTVSAQSFYKNPQGLFSTRPGETKSLTSIKRFGPAGMGIDLIQPAFTMRISHIESGSPAAATGRLKAGQIIESINGQKLKDIDPRIQLGRILAFGLSSSEPAGQSGINLSFHIATFCLFVRVSINIRK